MPSIGARDKAAARKGRSQSAGVKRPSILSSNICPLCLANFTIALECPTLVLKSEKRLQCTAPESMHEHLQRVAQHEPWIVGERHRHMAQLHPPLGAPSQKLRLRCRQMLGLHHRRRAIVLFQELVDYQSAMAESRGQAIEHKLLASLAGVRS